MHCSFCGQPHIETDTGHLLCGKRLEVCYLVRFCCFAISKNNESNPQYSYRLFCYIVNSTVLFFFLPHVSVSVQLITVISRYQAISALNYCSSLLAIYIHYFWIFCIHCFQPWTLLDCGYKSPSTYIHILHSLFQPWTLHLYIRILS